MIAVVGLGHWGKRHLETLWELLDPREVVGVDVLPAARAAAENLGATTVADVDELPDDVEAAVVATPTATHAEVASRLVDRGVHVLVEKPLADNAADGASLVDAARDRGVVLMVGHVFLYQTAHERLAEAMRRLGPPRMLTIERRTPGYVKPDSGAWLELAPHELAVAADLGALTAPVDVDAYLSWAVTGFGREDGAVARLRSDGCALELHCSWLSPVRSRRIWLVAEGGQALLDDDGVTQRLAVFEGPSAWVDEQPPQPEWTTVNGVPPLRRELSAFLDAVRGDGVVRSDGELGLRVVELMDRVTAWPEAR
jgi:UDP-N-acetylglucosamine 3-dehydrogenase